MRYNINNMIAPKNIRIIACTILFAVSETIGAQSTVHYTMNGQLLLSKVAGQ